MMRAPSRSGIKFFILLSLACAAWMVIPRGAWAEGRLLYVEIHKGSDFSAAKTNVFSLDIETGEKRLIFSDEKVPIVIPQHLYVFHFPVVGGGRLFAHAVERGRQAPFPGNGSLYELYVDGSNLFRRITPASGDESLGDILANSQGTRIGYINRMKRRQYLFIHDATSGNLLHQVDITDKFLDCYAASIGWLPREEKLFFSLQTGDVHVTSKASYPKVGTYIMDESGGHLKKIGRLPLPRGYRLPDMDRLIGVLPTGEYIFEVVVPRKESEKKKSPFDIVLARLRTDSQGIDDLSFSPETHLYQGVTVDYRLSPSGKYLAAAALPISSSALSWDIWLKSIQTGAERNIVSVPTEGLKGPFLGLIGWLD